MGRIVVVGAGLRGGVYDPRDPAYELEKSHDVAFERDPGCMRAFFDVVFVLDTPQEVFARPGPRDKILGLGSGWRNQKPFGPTREQLLTLASDAAA